MSRYRYMAFAALLAAVLVLAGCASDEAYAPDLLRPVAAAVDTATVTRGDVVAFVSRPGVTRYLSVPLYFDDPVADFGAFHVAPGDAVYAGQLLVTLDTESMEEQIERETERLADARRDFALSYEIRRLHIDLLVLEQRQNAARAAERFDADALEAAEAQAANIELQQMLLRHDRERHETDIRQGEARLDALLARRGNTSLYAPFDGLITYMASLNPGASLGVAQPILQITDGRRVVVEAILPGGDWPVIGPGGAPPNPWIPTPVRSAIQTIAHIGGQSFPLEYIDLQHHERDARPVRFTAPPGTPAGEYVTIHFYTQNLRDVLVIPTNALFTSGTHVYVHRLVNNEPVYTPIQLQLRTAITSAVAYGLQEGDEVIVRP